MPPFYLIMEAMFTICCFQNTYLIWDQIPFEWSRDSIPMGDPGAFLMAAGFGSEVLIWYDAPSPNDGYVSGGTESASEPNSLLLFRFLSATPGKAMDSSPARCKEMFNNELCKS